MGDFQSLTVWRKAADYAVSVYRVTARFPKEERFGLAAHLRKTAVSVVSNIAEGASKNGGKKDFRNFIRIALGSLGEARVQSYLAARLGFVDRRIADDLAKQARELRAILEALRKSSEA
ncbi:MAG TPA: four helix bundle protein [Gemmatimonadales bacterium]|nr:four helix bundle protein [Gemmatimonadales bacterium]